MASFPASTSPWSRGLEGVPGGALAFAALCLLALLMVACGMLFEVGRVRRESASGGGNGGNLVIGRDQFTWRIISALVWGLALALLAFASSWGWPRHALGLGLDARAWLKVLGGAMLLIFVGLMLLAQDVWRVKIRSAAQQEAFRQGLELLAQQEIERARRNPGQNSGQHSASPTSELARPLNRPELPNGSSHNSSHSSS